MTAVSAASVVSVVSETDGRTEEEAPWMARRAATGAGRRFEPWRAALAEEQQGRHPRSMERSASLTQPIEHELIQLKTCVMSSLISQKS